MRQISCGWYQRLHQISLIAVTFLIAAGFVCAGVFTPLPNSHAEENYTIKDVPVSAVTGFNPGMIISDNVFYNPNTMDAAAIQEFLNKHGRACRSNTMQGNDEIPCLKDYKENTFDRQANEYCTGAYVGAAGESAATILAKVSQACQINPQVLLVTLQKEQGFITATTPTLYKYQRAMGYGCPDTAPCAEKYFGFYNQVYQAAQRFQYYRLNPKQFRHRAGKVNQLLYHPSRTLEGEYKCGTVAVFIENQATAGLYNYTPYTPNAAALAAGGGLGDECSSYGNRNFFRFFTAWFGSPGSSSPVPSQRIFGNDRVDTAAAISRRAFPSGSQKAYIARADAPIDALAGGTLIDGPVLLVPINTATPVSVRNELDRLKAGEVVALGGNGAIPETVLADAAQGRKTSRIYGPDRYSTAIAISHQAFPNGAKRVYIADGVGSDLSGSPDAVVGGTLTDGPVLIIDPNNPDTWELVECEISNLGAETVVALGGESVVPTQAMKRIAGSLPTDRLAGKDRFATAAAIAEYAYPAVALGKDKQGGSVLSDKVLYLARGDNFADALVAGVLSDGPLLLVPSRTNKTQDEIHNYISKLRPNTVLALGGMGALHPDTVEAVMASVKAGF